MNKKKFDLIHNKIATKTKINFLQRVKHKINSKIISNRNFNVLFGLIKKFFRKKNFENFCQRIDKCFLNTKKLQEIFFKKIIIKHLILNRQIKQENNLQLFKLNSKFKKCEKEINFLYLKKIVKISYEYKQKNKLALIHLEKKYFDKVIKSFKLNKKMKRNKRTLLLKSKRFNEKNIKKKIFEKWKLYITYKKNKRNEYLYVQNKRNEILTKHFIKNLINISSEDSKINNNININNINNNNNKINIENNLYNEQININKINIEKNKNNNNNNLFDDLKEIRNKQRSKPVILDLDSL